MWVFLSRINKNLVIAIPLAMLAGFLWGYFLPSGNLKSLIVPMTFIMIYPMMTTLKIKNILQFNDIKTQLITQFVNFAVLPFVALLIGYLFFREQPYYALGLFLASLLPTSGMTISWTGFAKGNLESAVKMTVIGLTIGSLATPFYLEVFMGESIQFNMADIIKQIIYIVFIPMFIGQLTRMYFLKKMTEKEFKQNLAPRFSSFSTLGVLGVVFIAIALKAHSLVQHPLAVLYICLPVVVIYLFNYSLSTIIGKIFLPRGDAIALVYGTVMRNLSISLAIALNSFGEYGPDVALVIAVAFIFQVQSAAWYVRFTDKFFGSPQEKTA